MYHMLAISTLAYPGVERMVGLLITHRWAGRTLVIPTDVHAERSRKAGQARAGHPLIWRELRQSFVIIHRVCTFPLQIYSEIQHE